MSRQASFSALATGLLLLSGCESSDNATTPLTQGNPNDPNFQFVSQDVVNDRSYTGVEMGLDLTGGLIDSIPVPASVRHHWMPSVAMENGTLVIDAYSYALVGTWHVFQVSGYVAMQSPVDTFDLVGIDSIQLSAHQVPIFYPDATLDGFDYRLQFELKSRTVPDSLSGHHDVTVRLVDTATAKLNADLAENIHFQHSDSLATCDVNVANSFHAKDVLIYFGSESCPLAGSVVLTSAIVLDCQGLATSVDGLWTIRGHYNGTTEEYTVTDGSSVWAGSEPCSQVATFGQIW